MPQTGYNPAYPATNGPRRGDRRWPTHRRTSPDPSTCVLDAFGPPLQSAALPPLTVEQAYSGVDYGKKGAHFTIAPLTKVIAQSLTLDKAFLHFQCKSTTLTIRDVLTQIPYYGSNSSGQSEKVIIEYYWPNIAKSFHVGHLWSAIIGGFLANLYKVRAVELSVDASTWSPQFGLIATGFEKYGSQEVLEKDAIKHLFNVYVKVNKDAEADSKVKAEAARWFKRMEDGDQSALKNWRVWRALSMKKYTQEYDHLNIKFDVYAGESTYEEMGLIEDVDGAKIVNLEQWNMGKADSNEKYKFDKMIYVVPAQQDLHLAQFFKILEQMQFRMSTRKGTVVLLDQIIREAGQMQKNEENSKAVVDPETVSREIGITGVKGVKIQDMAAKGMISNYTFNWECMKSFEGDTGPYLQYAHVRLSSISRKNPHLLPLPPPSQIDTSSLATSSHAPEIVFLLDTYSDIISGVVTYAFRLSHAISSAWEVLSVKGEEDFDKARTKMWMYECARNMLAAAMQLLSIRPLDMM
ncbi:hypothetical protein B0H11DRAFT_2130071 [Mycena galericulata]|nr:hypothetical protein B0H11DRAFT_2130071 [Mycena galericulata]